MRINIPAFRLPRGCSTRRSATSWTWASRCGTAHPVDSMKALLDRGMGRRVRGQRRAQGQGARPPRPLRRPTSIHIGIEWLASRSTSATSTRIGRVLIIGVGNTAMDCCRTVLRLGATDVKVMARKPPALQGVAVGAGGRRGGTGRDRREPRPEAASSWRTAAGGDGVRAVRVDETRGGQRSEVLGTVELPCDDVVLAIGQENAFPWIERDIGIEFDEWDMPVVDRRRSRARARACSSAATRRGGRRTSSGRWSTATRRRSRSTRTARAARWTERPPQGMNLVSAKMGLHAVGVQQRLRPRAARPMTHVDLEPASPSSTRGGARVHARADAREVQRCLNCDVQTHFTAELCIECDACIDVCPVTASPSPPTVPSRSCAAADRAGLNPDQPLYASARSRRPRRLMVKDEDICLHCGLCAERCPTAAWDMRRFELVIPYAGRGPRVPATRRIVATGPRRRRSRPPRQRLRDQASPRSTAPARPAPTAAHAGHLPHGHPGVRQERVPVQHPGAAHLVRDPGQQATATRPHAAIST
jgi:formate dehydrogenase (NADP+) beta subunit